VPRWAEASGISMSLAIGALLLVVAFIMFIVYFVMDKKLDSQLKETEIKLNCQICHR
jgi:ABC-type sulfate transport system permease component